MVNLSGRIVARVGALTLDVEFDTGGERLVVVGPNGAGKTSLLEALVGAIPVDHGWVSVGTKRLLDTQGGIHVPTELRRLGYLPQSYALFPHLTVRQNVEFPMHERSKIARRQGAEQLLAKLGVGHLAERGTRNLSGGEMQRVALARALAAQPSALLLDEPLAAMDVAHRREVREFLVNYLTALALPTIIVTHDAQDAELLGTRILVIEAGHVTQVGAYWELASAPATPFVAQFTRDVRPATREQAP